MVGTGRLRGRPCMPETDLKWLVPTTQTYLSFTYGVIHLYGRYFLSTVKFVRLNFI